MTYEVNSRHLQQIVDFVLGGNWCKYLRWIGQNPRNIHPVNSLMITNPGNWQRMRFLKRVPDLVKMMNLNSQSMMARPVI